MARKIAKILSRIVLVLLLLLIAGWLLIQTSPVQNWLTKKAANWLAGELKTEVSVKHVNLSLFNKVSIEGVLVKDRNKDTLANIGKLKANITDWFFLKEKIELEYIGLEQTKLYAYRKDSVWNYQFLIDYFSSPGTGKKSKSQTDLRFKKVELKDIELIQRDDWRGQTMSGKLGYLLVNFKEFDLNKKIINAESVEIESPYFSINSYAGLRPKRQRKPDSAYHLNENSPVHWNEAGWKFSAADIRIANGTFKNDIATERAVFDYFDGAHIAFEKINGRFKDLKFIGDSLTANIQLSTKERSGFQVKQLKADFLFHPQGMEFSNLLAETNKSRLSNFFAMRYSQFDHDMSEFITHVRMEGVFNNSELHSDDIAFFAPVLKDWNDKINIKGRVRGTVDHLKGNDIVITTLKQTEFDGSFTMDGLPDINSTFLDLKSNTLRTSYADAAAIYPPLRNITYPAISKISYLNFTGSYTGFFNDFVTYGTIHTNLGTLVTDINLKLPKGTEAIYSGKIKTDGFALGTFIKDTLFGSIAMNGSVKGKGFNPKTLFAEVDGNVRAIYLNGYTYKNITAKGIYEKQKFDGAFVVNDSNLRVNLTGLVNFRKDTPVYKVTGDVYHINFKQLGFTKNDLRLKSYVDLDFKGRNIDDFLGTADLRNAVLTNDTTQLSFDYLSLSSIIIDGKKRLTASSNEADVSVAGDFNILDLPNATLSFLHTYFPSYIAQPKKQAKNQDFTFEITTRNIASYIDLLNIPVKGFDNSTVKGRISTKENTFEVQTDVPAFKYNNIAFNSSSIVAKGDYNRLNLQGGINEVAFNDSLSLPKTTFSLVAANDTGSVNIRTRATQTLKDADLNAKIKTSREGVEIVFQPSTLVVNDKVWNIEDKSDLFIGKNSIHSDRIRLNSGNESILVYTKITDTGSYSDEDVIVELNKVQIGDFMPYVLKDPRLEGQVTGRVDILNPLGKFMIETELDAERFRFNNDSIGTVKLSGNYNSQSGEINTKIISDNPLYDFFSEGKINIKDPKNPQIDQVIDAKNLKLSILEKYLSIIMTDMRGVANGKILVQGNAAKPDLIGNVKLSNASFVLDYTKVRYNMKEGTEIAFRKGEIDFGNIALTDTTNRAATFSGKLYHQFFDSMSFRMSFRANDTRRGLLVLNTTKKDNSLFYGKVIANASGTVNGDVDNLVLRFQGEPTDSSHIYLPTSDSRVTGTADFIVFRKYGKEMKVESQIKKTSNMLVDLDITANPLAKVDLILDEVTNDIIQGQGYGNLNIRTSTIEGTTMAGRYNITNGKYTFNWQKVFKKQFFIDNGSVEWNGDPYNANINIDAKYITPNIALPQDLVQGCSSNERSPITLISKLTGTLSNPVIQFRFELPNDHPCKSNAATRAGFERLYANPNELNNQVFSVLLFNQFLSTSASSSNSAANIGTSVLSSAAGTISEFIAQQLESGLGIALKNIPGINKLNLDPYVTFNPLLVSGLQAQGVGFNGTGNFGVTKTMLNGRLILKAGGSLLVNTGQATTTQTNQLTPDFTLEWLLSPDGKLRIIGFYRSVYDVQWRAANRTGISFSYVREFE
ncbi:hypothetical protein ESA94_02340 [Lacibacter luteus]|uniref:Translocation and assembly module TamB C-terminal domain-containing protein n=1 Tax=Lacibacter luteus TaxID=2508719 RepID=A0A4Q1CLK2_9BACT|nr:translocation/assembly module TamB domain-containing protein [Lacibacter luteus]RXK61876.1 hypothetical protein ESA94_02340 [Lacibacter luteus]